MNYRVMWEELKNLIEDNLKWHQSSIVHIEESIYRKQECKEILRLMRALEEEYRDE